MLPSQGAAFTFDATSYTSFVLSLRSSLPSIPFPTFSHALGDPLPSPFSIAPHQRIIILEGLYTLLDTEPWVQATKEFDERVWVECERSTARDRLVRRHLSSGIEQDVRAARERGEFFSPLRRHDQALMRTLQWIEATC